MVATLLSLSDARSAIGTSTGEASDDTLVQAYIDATTTTIEGLTGPIIDGTRTIARDGGGIGVMVPWPLLSVVSVIESGRTLTPDLYVADLPAGVIYAGSMFYARPWLWGVRNVVVTGTTGMATVPGNVTLAARELFKHLWTARNGPRPAFSEPGAQGAYIPQGFAVPNRVVELLVPTPNLPGFA